MPILLAPLPANTPLAAVAAAAPRHVPTGVWLDAAAREQSLTRRPLALNGRSGARLLIGSALHLLLAACDVVLAARDGLPYLASRDEIVAGRVLLLDAPSACPRGLAALRILFPDLTARPDGAVAVPLVERSAEEVLAASVGAGLTVSGTRVAYVLTPGARRP